MAISRIGGTGSDNWELISSVTPTAASAAVNFTGLSPYKKLLLRCTGLSLVGGTASIRLNNDSGNDYDWQYLENAYNTADKYATGAILTAQTSFALNIITKGFAIFSSCDNLGLKIMEQAASDKTQLAYQANGFYAASAIITEVNLVTGGTFDASGTVALYGVK
jgi:hypothetical protein